MNNIRIAGVIFLSMMFQTFGHFLKAQQKDQIAISPVMKISNPYSREINPMRLDILKIDIKVIGSIAITTLDMTYFNNNPRILEGEFNFPLGEGQTVSRFALDINGKLREGVVVEKEQGRKTFEAIVRRGVDPGLLEKTEGNNFRMRVYPLPAKGTRRVVIAFEQELTEKGKYDLYSLPLKISESIGKFSVHIEIVKNRVELDAEKNEFNNLSFNKWNDSYVADFEQANFTPDKQIALSFPHITNSEKVFTATKGGNPDSSWFYLNIRPEVSKQVKVLPKQITLLWDNSSSVGHRNIEKELMTLDAYIRKIGNLKIELVTFNIKTSNPEMFDITDGNWGRLQSAIKSMIYDGATSLGCIDFTRFRSDEILLFSDGMSTFGRSEPRFSNIPVIAINSSLSSNSGFLTYIAQRSGGLYIDLNKHTATEIASMLTSNNFHFISAQVQSVKISSVYPSMPCQFFNSFSLSGIMSGKSASIKLNFGFGTTVTYSKTIKIDADQSDNEAMLSRIWAEKKIAELSLNEEKNKDEITLTGKKYGIVTANTSLIVLDNLEDYLRYNIVPPEDTQEKYFKIKNASGKDISSNTKDHINYVLKLSDKQSKWWNTNFPLPIVSANNKVKFTPPVIKPDEMVAEEDEPKMQREIIEEKATTGVVNFDNGTDDVAAPIAREERTASNNFVNETVIVAGSSNRSDSKIQLFAWDPQTPYLKVLQYVPAGEKYNTYLKLKKEYGSTPSFYIDATDFFSKSMGRDTVVTILSNLAELEIESPQLLRVLGKKLIELKRYDEAILVFQKVLKLRGEEPQSYRDLGHAFEAKGDFNQAIRTLYEIVKKEWDDRFPGIELIVMNEINNIIHSHPDHPELKYTFVDKRLIKFEPVDIRVELTWDTDNCDIDLWVTDPKGEKCFYDNKLTRLGGKISNDFTGGYGPEEFMIKKAVDGEYLVQANYYGTRSQSLLAPVNLHLVFYTNFGSFKQKKKEVNIRLENKQDVINIGKFSFKGDHGY